MTADPTFTNRADLEAWIAVNAAAAMIAGPSAQLKFIEQAQRVTIAHLHLPHDEIRKD